MNNINPSFEEAIDLAILWCDLWEKEELSNEVLADKISDLISSKNGARAFFAVSLASNCPLMDRIPEEVVFKLNQSIEIVVDLIVKNLAMSTAMSIHHNRRKNNEVKESSEKVLLRCIDLLRLLDSKMVDLRVRKMLDGTIGIGEDSTFLKKWNYDEEQKEAISSNLRLIAE